MAAGAVKAGFMELGFVKVWFAEAVFLDAVYAETVRVGHGLCSQGMWRHELRGGSCFHQTPHLSAILPDFLQSAPENNSRSAFASSCASSKEFCSSGRGEHVGASLVCNLLGQFESGRRDH